jgi:hypothetical protein
MTGNIRYSELQENTEKINRVYMPIKPALTKLSLTSCIQSYQMSITETNSNWYAVSDMDARRNCFIEKMIKTILAKYVSP